MKSKIRIRPAFDKYGKQLSWNWYIWDEICDKCGSTIHNQIESTEAPDMEKADFCPKCLQELMDLKIPFCTGTSEINT